MHSIIILLLFLAGCAGGGHYGPRTPVGGIGKGSIKSYYCRGEWHYPQNFYEYDKTGLASWYGPGFHGKPKPYGEKFNMHGISAAHRTLPLPTVVKVTNLQNGKAINLVVDDRGPFVYEGRIIDLSVGAAKALGTYSKGLVTVRVQSLPGESRLLSDYLAKHGNKSGKMRDGRTWQQVYAEEIAGKNNQATVKTQESGILTTKSTKKALSNQTAKLDDILKSVTPQAMEKNPEIPKSAASLNTYINLGEAYIQKNNAQKIAASFPKTWNASVQPVLHPSGQMLYNIKVGPFNGQTSQQLLKQLHKKGYAQAIAVKD
ncbi:MAG: septal ring lytic transglycosylase RlpA family protein [Proteobacteria bacterium]|nr:septal ring lytic transglycosylase RlpA family protein [Pseudomonadota bacterium]